MAFNAWVALAPCSIKRTLIDGRLLCENLYRYREGPHSSPKTGLEALPGVRPAMFNIFFKHMFTIFFKHMFTIFLKHILTYFEKHSCSIIPNVCLTYFTRNVCWTHVATLPVTMRKKIGWFVAWKNVVVWKPQFLSGFITFCRILSSEKNTLKDFSLYIPIIRHYQSRALR